MCVCIVHLCVRQDLTLLCCPLTLLPSRPLRPSPPPLQVIDRVHFIINNITSLNIEQKVKDLKAHVGVQYWPWFANYLVVKRAAQVGGRRWRHWGVSHSRLGAAALKPCRGGAVALCCGHLPCPCKLGCPPPPLPSLVPALISLQPSPPLPPLQKHTHNHTHTGAQLPQYLRAAGGQVG